MAAHNLSPEQIAARDTTVAEIHDTTLQPGQRDLYFAASVGVALIGEETGDQDVDEINVARLRLIALIGKADAADMSNVLAEAAYLLMLLQGGAGTPAPAGLPDPLQGVLSQPAATQSQSAATTAAPAQQPDPAQQQAPAQPPTKQQKKQRLRRPGMRVNP